MKNILLAFVAFLIIGLGAFAHYIIDPSRPVVLSAPDGLCIDVLRIQTTLPLGQYAMVKAENLVGIAKNNQEYMFVYPLVPGLSIASEQPSAKLIGTLPNSDWKLYRVDHPEAMPMFAVQAPLPFYIASITRVPDPQVAADLETFARGVRPVSQCDAAKVRYTTPINPIQAWFENASPAAKQGIVDSYTAYAANYRQPVPKTMNLKAVGCSILILDKNLKELPAAEQDGFATAFNRLYGAASSTNEIFKQPKVGGISLAVATLIREYLAPRLRAETPPAVQDEVNKKILAAAKGKVDVTGFSKTDCATLPVPAKYKK